MTWLHCPCGWCCRCRAFMTFNFVNPFPFSSLLQSCDQEVVNKVKAGLKSLIPTLEKNKSTSKGVETLLEKLTA